MSFAGDITKNLTEEVAWYMIYEKEKGRNNIRDFINKSLQRMEERRDAHFVIRENISGKFIGCASLYDVNTKTPEMGVWLTKDCWGKGYGFEVFSALKKFAKEIKCTKVICRVAKGNMPSKRIVEKVGGEMTGHVTLEENFAGKQHIFLFFHIEL
jgi:RimJ/RimL family protein N-acetyltransferase